MLIFWLLLVTNFKLPVKASTLPFIWLLSNHLLQHHFDNKNFQHNNNFVIDQLGIPQTLKMSFFVRLWSLETSKSTPSWLLSNHYVERRFHSDSYQHNYNFVIDESGIPQTPRITFFVRLWPVETSSITSQWLLGNYNMEHHFHSNGCQDIYDFVIDETGMSQNPQTPNFIVK